MPDKQPEPPRPTDGELEILTVLWSRGASTVRDVHQAIATRKPTQYTTVLKLMQIMAEKGLLQRDEEQRAHIYRASRPAEWTRKQLAGHLLQRAFSGSAKSLLVGALAARKVSPRELAEIRQLLDEYEKGGEMNYLDTPAAQALGWTLLHFLWEGALIAALLAVAWLFARGSSRVRYALAALAMLAMPLTFGVTFALLLPEQAANMPSSMGAGLMRYVTPVASAAAPLRSGIAEAVRWAVPFWIAGVVAFYLRSFLGWLAARRLRRASVCHPPAEWRIQFESLLGRLRVSRPVTLLESALTEVPVVIGFLRPVVLMPVGLMAGLPVKQVEAILIHELAHIRRWDYLVNLAQNVIEGLLFYHPAVWWVSAAIRAERENCCDDVVVEIACDRHGYAAALATLEQIRCAAHQPALAATGGNLMKRIRRILRQPEGPNSAVSPVLCSGILLVLAAFLLAAWPSSRAAAQAAVPKTGPHQTSASHLAPYTKWLEEDVAYIITDAESAEFHSLSSDADRERFIERFWQHRDKAGHYQRIAYANEHFPASVPGWKTQRGQIYIKHGAPSAIEHRGDLEVWTYKDAPGVVRSHLGGCGSQVPLLKECESAIYVFADPGHSGDYQLKTIDHRPESSLRESSLHKTLYTWHMNAFRFFHSLFHWSN